MNKKQISRRKFLYLSALGAASIVLGTVAVQGKASSEEPSANLIQKEETESIAATSGKEAPELSRSVQLGLLPPLEDRLPEHPLILAPVDRIGKYGGYFLLCHWWLLGGAAAGMYGHSPLRWINDGLGVGPGQCEGWEASENNTVWTLYFRKGMKWSDGSPVTTSDVVYWWNEMVLEPDHSDPIPTEFRECNGPLPIFSAIDDFTLRIAFHNPTPLLAKRLAMWVNGQFGYRWIVPSNYAKQFNPKYNPAYSDYQIHDQRLNYMINPECPVLTAWKLEEYHEDMFSKWVRNPYYYAVDPAGKQLPYVEFLGIVPSSDSRHFLLRTIQGSVSWEVYTYQLALSDIPILKAYEEEGNYEFRFWDGGSGTGMMYFWNHDVKDDAKRALFRTPKFKAAMSLAINRQEIQRVVYFDMGCPTTGTLSPKALEFNFTAEAQAKYEGLRTSYVDYDPIRAMSLLDEIGVIDVNGDGYREMPDGSPLLIRLAMDATTTGEPVDVFEITQQNWRDVGLNVVINWFLPEEFAPLWRAGLLEFRTAWEVSDGPDHLLNPEWVVPVDADRWAPLTGQLRQVAGTPIEGTELELSPWDRTPPRFDVRDPEYANSRMPELHALYDQAIRETDAIQRMQLVWQMNEIHKTDGPYFIGTICNSPRIVIVSKDLENVPTREQLALGGFCNPWSIPYPAITNPETYAFKKPYDVFLPTIRR